MATAGTNVTTPYIPAEYIEYPKPSIPYCWTPEPVINVPDNPPGPDPVDPN